MGWWQQILLAFGVASVLAGVAWLLVWRPVSARVLSLARRVRRLPSGERIRLAQELAADRRLPPPARVALAGAVTYLWLTFDLIPDFIPGLGRLDDAVVLALGVGLLLHRRRFEIVEEHLTAIEAGIGSSMSPGSQQPPARSRLFSAFLRFGGGRLSRRRQRSS